MMHIVQLTLVEKPDIILLEDKKVLAFYFLKSVS